MGQREVERTKQKELHTKSDDYCHRPNTTKLGCGRVSLKYLAEDLTEPFIAAEDWDMLQ